VAFSAGGDGVGNLPEACSSNELLLGHAPIGERTEND
jgi:hypothetical protein